MNLLYYSLSFYLCLSSASAAAPKETAAPEPCTIRSPTSHAFFDLNPLHIEDPMLSKSKHPRDYSWNATGWGLGYNFTLNFCGPVIEDLDEMGGVAGVERSLWKNVSAYYKQNGKLYSIGLQNSAPVFHGRKMVLNYTNGSPCDADAGKREHVVEDLSRREILDPGDEDDDSEDDDRRNPNPSTVRRKSTIISMLCDKDPLSPLLTLSYVAVSPDECTYFFEARSSAACGGIETAKQTLSPAGVFGVIALIAVIVYLVGGCFYSRMVLQQRGWRQLPNYALWASILGFIKVGKLLRHRMYRHLINGIR